MKQGSKTAKSSKPKCDRTLQEQIRKRRHNLFKRFTEFNTRYGIEIWHTMQMPTGRLYKFDTGKPQPTEAEVREHQLPVVRKTPADYKPSTEKTVRVRDPPTLAIPRPSYCAGQGHDQKHVKLGGSRNQVQHSSKNIEDGSSHGTCDMSDLFDESDEQEEEDLH